MAMERPRPRSAHQQVGALLGDLLSNSGASASGILASAERTGVDIVSHAAPVLDGLVKRRMGRGRHEIQDQFTALAKQADALDQVDHDRFAAFIITGLTARPSDGIALVGELVNSRYPLHRHLDALAPIMVDLWRRAQDDDRVRLARSLDSLGCRAWEAGHPPGEMAACCTTMAKAFASGGLASRSGKERTAILGAVTSFLTPHLQSSAAGSSKNIRSYYESVAWQDWGGASGRDLCQRIVGHLRANGCSLTGVAREWMSFNATRSAHAVVQRALSDEAYLDSWTRHQERPVQLPSAATGWTDSVDGRRAQRVVVRRRSAGLGTPGTGSGGAAVGRA